MDPPCSLLWDIVELSTRLRQERLFVLSEQNLLHELNEKVVNASSKLAQVAWITSQQRLNLNHLVLSRPDSTPAICCKRANFLDSTKFIDAQSTLGFQKCAAYGELLCILRDSPELVSRCLVAGDRCLPDDVPKIVHSLIAGLYASCVLPRDKYIVIKVLSHLMNLQMIQSETPRRLLRPGSCAFSCLYSAFHESLFSAKLFLTAALHGPIMRLLTMEEKYLDVDPARVALRLEERAKIGPDEGNYGLDFKTHRTSTVKNLVEITQFFINSIQENLYCFPSSVSYLVNQIYSRLTKVNSIPQKEIFAICTDLVFTLFICPAIVKPGPHGITDVPISSVACFNLIQVAQIIQMLALRKFEATDPKLEDIYSQFDKDCVSSIIETMIDSNLPSEEPNMDENGKFEHLSRTAALLTENELNCLVSFLRTISCELNCDDVKMRKELNSLLSQIPPSAVNGFPKNSHVTASPETPPRKGSILSRVGKHKTPNGTGSENGSPDEEESEPCVLVIPFDLNTETSLGLDSEQKILALEKKCGNDGIKEKASKIDKNERSEGQEKRTRFSLSHDDGSIGNTSDNLEVVSEAPSNHSVASSLELETEDQNDNLSDMVSANVSGRGSPNISGRDTPSSQITEGEEVPTAGPVRPQMDFNPPPPPKLAPQPRFDLDDKFGKFEIKSLMEGAGADETFSLVSDTWSTDVLASDSEILEQLPLLPPPLLPPPLLPEPSVPTPLVDITETASEAWSMDVMASDSERMTEVDTDETASVARSDDTGRSEIESRGELEASEDSGSVQGLLGAYVFRGGQDLRDFCSAANVTGRGGARSDYRRRTLEYLDNNRNIYSKLGSDECDDASVEKSDPGKPPGGATISPSHVVSIVEPAVPSLLSTPSPKTPFRPSPTSTSQSEERIEEVTASVGCFSGSSSSSGSSVGARNNSTGDVSLPTTPLFVPNGSPIPEIPVVSKPTTGAIPKSISFDKTAEKGDKESLDEDGKPKRSFFRNFKLPFKNRRGKSFRNDCFESNLTGDDLIPPLRLRRGASEDGRPLPRNDTSDDILAKYRGQRNFESEEKKSEATVEDKPTVHLEKGYDLIEDARKKLRLALSSAEVQRIPESIPLAWMRKDNELIAFLQLQLAEAINLQDSCLIPQLYETLRCIKMLSDEECRKLFESLKDDYKSRTPYIAYLIKCRQSLLSTLSHLHRLIERVKRDRTVVLEFLSSMCVRIFLEKRETQLINFTSEFESLTLADEKCDSLDAFLNSLYLEMQRDPVWNNASEDQLAQARVSVERCLFSRVYVQAMYPNGDGDISRDQVLQEHITKLAEVISPEHKDLRIPQMFHGECPWLSAQAEIGQMAAYRSPRDKLLCVLRCITTIMNLLSLTCVPAADDLMPVLVYVLIMANPPSLLSTIEYVTSFYGNRLEGEEQYYWTQFCSAIEFIKTMDYLTE